MRYPFSLRPSGLRIVLLGVLPGLLLLAAFIYLALGSDRLEDRRILIRQNNDVLATANAIQDAIQDAERGQRGFLLTESPGYLEPYNTAVARIPQLIAKLRHLTAEDADQQQRILLLRQSLTAKIDELNRTIELQRTQGQDAALALVRANIDEDAMKRILGQLTAITDAEQIVREARLKQNVDTQQKITQISFIGGVVAMLAIGWSAFTLYRSYLRSRASEAALQSTLDSVREGVSAFDSAHRLIAWNQTFSALAQVPGDGLRSGQALDSIEQLKAGGTIGEDIQALDMRARHADKPLLVEHQRQDGRIIELFHNPSPDGGFVTTYTDITDQRRDEALQRQAQKMESLGHMTGGIAHDFNNLLTVIVGNLELLKNRVGDDPKAQRHVDMALLGADRGAKLTHQLLAFARRQPLEPRPVTLAQLLPDLTDMLRRTLGELIEIETVGAPGLWNVSIDPHQFESAVLNLAINARDAMPQGGKLTLELANVRLDDAYAALHDEIQAGQYVVFGVTDTGAGMPPEVQARAFDPFFSTKGEGGTGLGLSMVFGFVKQSGGHVKIYSEPGHGTTVKLYLPRTVDGVAVPYERTSSGDTIGTETILVVEDEEPVRATVTALIGGLGYRVLEAANGASALLILESEEQIDLMFTDVIMPGPVSSRVLADRARELRPSMKILFTSGYTENTIVHNGRLDAGVQLISKPYGRDQLAQKLRSVLGQS
jgi:signal transduction histidine kinase/CHASE3 domain sensor protein